MQIRKTSTGVRSMTIDGRFERFSPEKCAITATEILACFPAAPRRESGNPK